MAAPAFVQSSSVIASSASDTAITLTGVAAGNTLAVMIVQGNTSVRTYSVSDDRNGVWTQATSSGSGRSAHVWYKIGVAAGDTVITIDQSSTHQAYTVVAVEIGPSAIDVAGNNTDAANVTTHYCAASGSLDTTTNIIVLSCGALGASGGTVTKNASATLIGSATTYLFQYRQSETALADERSEWTSSTARADACASASFVATSSGISGASSYTEGNDTLAATSAIVIAASSGLSEGNDTLSSAGVLPIVAVLSITEGDDTNNAAGESDNGNQGSSTITEGDDTLGSTSTIQLTATSGLVEGNDSISCTAGVRIAAVATSLELNDTVNAAASIGSASSASCFYSMLMR